MNGKQHLFELVIGIKGAGEMASGIAWRLFRSNLKKIFLMEIENPLAVRREVTFCEAVRYGRRTVEGVEAVLATDPDDFSGIWEQGKIPVLVDPQWESVRRVKPEAVIDAILAKRNTGTCKSEAPLVIGLGPGFEAGRDVHAVIETQRGHDLGRVITSGCAAPNTGVPGEIGGHSAKRVMKASIDGVFQGIRSIGDIVEEGEIVGYVDGDAVRARLSGVVRGIIANGTAVTRGLKLGDVDPRAQIRNCITISEKARAIGGGVLEALLNAFNR